MAGVVSVRFLRFLAGAVRKRLILVQRKRFFMTALLIGASCGLLSCAGAPSGHVAPTASAQGTFAHLQQVPLTSLHWCGTPLMVFRDEGAPSVAGTTTATPVPSHTPATVQSWSQVKQSLGFQVFLPVSLPVGSCLVSVYGTVHDPILGSSFTIAYLLPDHTSLSLSEAPSHSSQAGFQCSLSKSAASSAGTVATPTHAGPVMQLCSGNRDTTNIVFAAPWSAAASQAFFQALQADAQWQPAT